MPQEKHHIEELFSDAQPINEKAVVEALKPHITIQRDSKDIYLKNSGKLTIDEKVLVYSLAKKLLKLKGLVEQEAVSANEFYKRTGVKKGSVDSAFKKLREDGLLVGSGQNYEIPNYKIDEVVAMMLVKDNKDKKKS